MKHPKSGSKQWPGSLPTSSHWFGHFWPLEKNPPKVHKIFRYPVNDSKSDANVAAPPWQSGTGQEVVKKPTVSLRTPGVVQYLSFSFITCLILFIYNIFHLQHQTSFYILCLTLKTRQTFNKYGIITQLAGNLFWQKNAGRPHKCNLGRIRVT